VNERGCHMEDDECPDPCEEQKKRDGKKNEPHKQSPFRHRHIDEALSDQRVAIGHSPVTPFAQIAKPMTAVLADLRELTRPLSAFAAFQLGHFLPSRHSTLHRKRQCLGW
jgi:hypothetical protein